MFLFPTDMDEEPRSNFRRLIVEDLIKLSLVATVGGSILYSTYHPAPQSEEQTAVPASEATLSTLKQKCGGKSYTIAIEDFPGRAEFKYDAKEGAYSVSLGLSASGVNECETYENHECVAYKSDFAPTKSVYTDTNSDGLVDLVMNYKQNRDGTEEVMGSRHEVSAHENRVYTQFLEDCSTIQPDTTSVLVRVAPCSQ